MCRKGKEGKGGRGKGERWKKQGKRMGPWRKLAAHCMSAESYKPYSTHAERKSHGNLGYHFPCYLANNHVYMVLATIRSC